jgi:hypothetical protein
MWPVDAVVGENGAFYMRYDATAHKLVRRFVDDEATRRRHRERLAEIADRIVATVPGSALASDQRYREADVAIDFCEDVPPLERAAIDRIVAMMEAEGMTAKVSSIHVNGWFGGYDKLSTTRLMLREEFAIDVDAARDAFVFAGDSPNDQPMFEFFPNAVGVANVRDMEELMTRLPAWVTPSRGSHGSVAGRWALTPEGDPRTRRRNCADPSVDCWTCCAAPATSPRSSRRVTSVFATAPTTPWSRNTGT